jgi:PIN domain nuclease of toxin-antitoxin system
VRRSRRQFLCQPSQINIVYLWWDGSQPALNPKAQAMIRSKENNVFVSAVPVWEIAIKRRLGKLTFHGPVSDTIGDNGFHGLPILPIDGENAGDLEWHHTDPFDRLLVVQAMRLGFTLLTANRTVREFGDVAQVWAG